MLTSEANEAELQIAGIISANREVAQILASGCSHSESGCGKCSGCNNGWCNGH
jgi:hypothetical protein